MGQIWLYAVIYVVAGVVVFLLGLSFGFVRRPYRSVLLRRFWGKAAFDQNLVIAYGTLTDSRLTQPDPPPYRYVKRYHDGRAFQLVGPAGNVPSGGDVRAVSYITNSIRPYRTRAVGVVDDVTAFANLNRSIVAVGGPFSNEVTDLILREPNNRFVEFGQEGGVAFIRDKRSDTKFESAQSPVRKDYGVILKIPNLRFPGYHFFACAGLGEWGTSGAAWYLSRQWRRLQSEFGGPFAVVVEVEIGSDESARRVFPDLKKAPANK
jgi:hypothetical protein